jgi:hypothetical protein
MKIISSLDRFVRTNALDLMIEQQDSGFRDRPLADRNTDAAHARSRQNPP